MTNSANLIDVKPVNEESYGNVVPLLHEIRHALTRFQESGETTTIDLRRIPMTEHDENQLENFLGVGEVSVEINAVGPTHVFETQFAAVWHIEHRNADGEIATKFIMVTSVPDLVKTQPEDANRSIRALNQRLNKLTKNED